MGSLSFRIIKKGNRLKIRVHKVFRVYLSICFQAKKNNPYEF